jgi:hypothetical protein
MIFFMLEIKHLFSNEGAKISKLKNVLKSLLFPFLKFTPTSFCFKIL